MVQFSAKQKLKNNNSKKRQKPTNIKLCHNTNDQNLGLIDDAIIRTVDWMEKIDVRFIYSTDR